MNPRVLSDCGGDDGLAADVYEAPRAVLLYAGEPFTDEGRVFNLTGDDDLARMVAESELSVRFTRQRTLPRERGRAGQNR